jgi:hypothetical protein
MAEPVSAWAASSTGLALEARSQGMGRGAGEAASTIAVPCRPAPAPGIIFENTLDTRRPVVGGGPVTALGRECLEWVENAAVVAVSDSLQVECLQLDVGSCLSRAQQPALAAQTHRSLRSARF